MEPLAAQLLPRLPPSEAAPGHGFLLPFHQSGAVTRPQNPARAPAPPPTCSGCSSCIACRSDTRSQREGGARPVACSWIWATSCTCGGMKGTTWGMLGVVCSSCCSVCSVATSQAAAQPCFVHAARCCAAALHQWLPLCSADCFPCLLGNPSNLLLCNRQSAQGPSLNPQPLVRGPKWTGQDASAWLHAVLQQHATTASHLPSCVIWLE